MTGTPPEREQGSGGFAASMSLLTTILARPLDPGYEAAARRRAEGGPQRRSVPGMLVLGLFAVALGGLTVTAAVTLRAPQPAVVQARAVLEDEVRARSLEVADAETELAALDAEIQGLQRTALEASDPELLAQLALDETVSGAVALEGPGVRVTLADAADAGEGDVDRRVHDSDLRVVVNGLWAAGAEAVSVNGLRVNSLTAIRSAGQAVLVDLVPLVGPYVVEAIGDPDRLPTRFASTAARDHLALLRAAYDIHSSVEAAGSLTAPAAAAPTLDRAAPLEPAVEAEEET
ncbi:MAG: DUF881 domain-containing protein [Actinomycetota bacterium]|nr:DUF881 domain-containing protein [Actinomycetota bacterium]